ncbi:MAG: transposase [Desulfomonile tiedjei]|nr:transposase [Desulfomonile tiedjei]
MISFRSAKIASDPGFLLLRKIDGRFGILGPTGGEPADARSQVHSNHLQRQIARQRIYQIAAEYEDPNTTARCSGESRLNPG